MILQKSILAILLASGAASLGTLAAVPHALAVLFHWDLSSGSARQLRLERRSLLVSTGMAFLLALQAATLLLFIFNADRMASQFTGAMCAVGTLQAAKAGFPALMAQIAAFFGASVWLTMNAVDGRCRDYPLTRAKFAGLLVLIPLLALTFALELAYFLGLDATVITSCCGSLFSSQSPSVSGDLAAWPVERAAPVFFSVLAATVFVAGWAALRGRGGLVLGFFAVCAFVVALAGVVSFVSLYVYEHPHHHCPFCLLKAEYGYAGYGLYIPLFLATAASLGAAALAPFAGRRSRNLALVEQVRHNTRLLGGVALAGYSLFLLQSAWQVASSGLRLMND